MYARHFVFKAKSGMRPEVEALADQAFGLMKSLDGFISVHFLISEDETEFGSFSLWESKNDAEAAAKSIRSKTSGSLNDLAVELPAPRLYEVYKPKT